MESRHHHGFHSHGGHGGPDDCCERSHEHRGSEGCCCAHGQEHERHGQAGEEVRLRRRFRSREERLAHLEQYRNDLQAELKGVEEHIAEIRSAT